MSLQNSGSHSEQSQHHHQGAASQVVSFVSTSGLGNPGKAQVAVLKWDKPNNENFPICQGQCSSDAMKEGSRIGSVMQT